MLVKTYIERVKSTLCARRGPRHLQQENGPRDAFILRDMWTRIDEAGSHPYMGLNHPVKYASLRGVLDTWAYVPGSTDRNDRSFSRCVGRDCFAV
jgi:hypothetical protein